MWLAAVAELLLVALAVAIDLESDALRQRVHDRHTHAVESTGHLVALATELAAGVQHGEHHFSGALALVRTGRIRVDRDTAPVVVDTATAVGGERDSDPSAETGHGLVDRVVDDFPDEVVQTSQTGGTDVHTGPLADRVETLENLDVLGAVIGRGGRVLTGHWYLVVCFSGPVRTVSHGWLTRATEGLATTGEILP